MKKIIQWLKTLFTKKQVKNAENKTEVSAIKNPDGKPTRGPR